MDRAVLWHRGYTLAYSRVTEIKVLFSGILFSGTLPHAAQNLVDYPLFLHGRSAVAIVVKARSTPATMSKQHCRMLQCRMLLRHCCRFGNNVESSVRLCCPKRQHCSCLLLRQCCFDIVASVDRALVRPCQLSSTVSSLSHRAPTFLYNTLVVIRLRPLSRVFSDKSTNRPRRT